MTRPYCPTCRKYLVTTATDYRSSGGATCRRCGDRVTQRPTKGK